MLLRLLCAAALVACGGGSSKPSTTTTTVANPAGDSKILVHTDETGVALGGNDATAYAAQQVQPGAPEHSSSHGGATYLFASAENKQKFDAAPAQFAPAYGGFCAYAASLNRVSPSDPAVYLVHEGQLLMFTNEDFRTQFQQDPTGNKQKADANWPALVEKHGKPPA